MPFFRILFLLVALLSCPWANAAAPITDFRFGEAQTFDVQWSFNAGTNTLTTSNFTNPFSSTVTAQAANGGSQQVTLQPGQYYRFIDSVTNPGTYGMAVFESNGTQAYVVHDTGVFYFASAESVFYLGNGFFGTLITTATGYNYGDAASFTPGIENPTHPQVEGLLPANSVPLAPGQSQPTGVSLADLGASMLSNAVGLRTLFADEAASLARALVVDCTSGAAGGPCVSAQGGTASTGSLRSNSVSLVAAWSLTPSWRVGAYLEQGSGWQGGSSGLNASNGQPLVAGFAVYTPTAGNGAWTVRSSLAYRKRELTTTRVAVGSATAGSGTADLEGAGASVEVGALPTALPYGAWSPYIGLRRVTVRRDGYTETSGTSDPLTYAPASLRTTTATAGLRWTMRVTSAFTVQLDGGVEHDLASSTSDYLATMSGGDSIRVALSDTTRRTRPMIQGGAYVRVGSMQRLGIQAERRQSTFSRSASTQWRAVYEAGF
jgi:hypothetical protein